MTKLSRHYRYSTRFSGVVGEARIIQLVGGDPVQQNRFNAEIQLITISEFREGYAGNTIYTSHPPVVFQHPDMYVNRQRAQQVTQKWRDLKRRQVNILRQYRQYSPTYRILSNK